MVLIIFSFGIQRALVMFKYSRYQISQTTDYDFYDDTSEIGSDFGLVFAFGISSYNKETEHLSLDYGTIRAY